MTRSIGKESSTNLVKLIKLINFLRVNNYKYFDDPKKNKCEGFDYRCIGAEGPCGCWRNDHTFPADTICDV